ncbi:MAG: hypothetical protein GY738_10125, partial [Pseudoalteromonas sp.]|nr:hypothetical protein [Pseudoalteromonas sp.]
RGAETPTDIVRVVEQLRQLASEPDRSFYGGKSGGGGQRNFNQRPPADKKNEQASHDPPPAPSSFIPPIPPFNPNQNAFVPRGRGGAGTGGGRGRGGGGGARGGLGQGGPPAETPAKCFNCGQFGHLRRNCPRPLVPFTPQGGARGAVTESSSSDVPFEPWNELLARLKASCKTSVFVGSERGSNREKAMATRKVPRLPICIDGVFLRCYALM